MLQQDFLNKIEEQHTMWLTKKQEEIKIIDKNLSEKYMKLIPISDEINLQNIENIENIKNKVEKDKEIITNIEKTIQELRNYQDDINNINNKINTLNKTLLTITQSELPNNIIQYLEETPIFDIEDTIEQLQSSVSKQFIKKVKDTLKNTSKSNSKTEKNKNNKNNKTNEIQLQGCSDFQKLKESLSESNIYRYIEDYQDEFESNLKEKEKIEKQIQQLNDKKNILCAEIKKIPDELQKLENKKKLHNENITFLNEMNQLITAEKENEKINTVIKELEEEKISVQNEKDNIYEKEKEKYLDIQNCIQIKTYLKELSLKKKEISENYNQLIVFQQQVDKNEIIEEEICNSQERLERIEITLKNLDRELNVTKSRFVANNTKIQVLKKDIESMKTLEKEIELFTHYQSALKSLPYILIDKVRPVLEKKINDLLSVTTDFMVKIEIENTRIEIYLDRPVYNGKPILLNNASGFERFISSLAIRLALLDISQLPKANFMAIDEGWTSFDNHNINNVRTIFDFLVNKFDFVISISHLQQIKEHCHQQLRLIKNKDGFSKIIVA